MTEVTYKQSYSTEEIKEKALLIGVHTQVSEYDFESTMSELEALSETCGLEVKATLTQNLNDIHPRHYMGER